MVTREDFNIEDIHCQMVFKIQREQQLLREIEGGDEAKITDMSALHDNNLSSGPHSSLIDILDGEEILSGDMCVKSAINWGKNAIDLNKKQSHHDLKRLSSNQNQRRPENQSSHQRR